MVTAFPFGLATVPLEITKVVDEVKLMPQARGFIPPSQEICQVHIQTLLALCQGLGWVVNVESLELIPKQVFNFIGT